MSTTTQAPATDLAEGVWTVDPGHAEVAFVGRHFGLTKIRGRFAAVDGTVAVRGDLATSTVDVTIDMKSVSSGDAARDDHLRSTDFFDVEHHPTATFRSTAVAVDGSSGSITGELTIKGITRPVTLAVDALGQVTDPWGGERAVFHAEATVNREDWGLTWNMVLDAGGLLVSKQIQLEIDVELLRSPA